ncbi:hypothetical protein N9A86_00820 [Akkermansiaceae bacterium]|nr:hypothetical protein [Akkermansiaceae bacterium]
MELEKVTAEIRPRTQWEAVDLGLSLVRKHAGLLLKIWLSSIIPLCLVILGLFWNALFWGCFLIWWLKPIWERVTLYPLSRSLFGETPQLSQAIKVLPKELRRNWKMVSLGVILSLIGLAVHRGADDPGDVGLAVLYWLVVIGLLFYRSNLYRSLVLPIKFLEGLDRTQYRARSQVLSFRSSGTASALTALCLVMEFFVFFSQFYYIDLMIPSGTAWEYSQVVADFFDNGPGILPAWIVAIASLFYLNAVMLVTWFYVGGGFGLYVNSRTWTEGWDIELTFKRLGQRVGLILIGCCLFFITPSAQAQSDEVTIERILADDDFEVQVREIKTRKEEEKNEEEMIERDSDGSAYSGEGMKMLVQGGSLIFWMIVTMVVAGLIWLIVTNRQMFKAGPREDSKDEKKKVRTVAGMNVTPESLPKRLVEVARDLWNQGKHKEALGLLYRGAISSLVTRQLVDIEESDTELDCLYRVLARGESASPQYFESLTEAWMIQAYASQSPDDDLMSRIWSQWPFGEGGKS